MHNRAIPNRACGSHGLAWLWAVAAAAAMLPHWHHSAGRVSASADRSTSISGEAAAATSQGSSTLNGIAGSRARTLDGVVGDGGDTASSLLEKYTFLETVRTVVEEEHLPELGDFLEQIGLANRLEDFYRKNVFETKYLFTLNDMDLRLMGLSPQEMTAVKRKTSELRVERDVTEERIHPLLARRNGLTYGRLFLDRSASSFEFYLAGFGPPAPVDEARLVWANPRNACHPSSNSDLSGAIVLAVRGQCSFVDKANIVASSNAAALVVINNGEEGEELFRVAATLGGRSGGEPEPKGPENMATVMVRGSTLPALSKALEWGSVTARLVPLECKPGKAACESVLSEEKEAEMQVDSGIMSTFKVEGDLSSSEAFEFLSATFGATLPRGHIAVVPSVPEEACSPLSEVTLASIDGSGAAGGAAVLVKRGGCSFGAKAKHVQEAGGRVLVVQDTGLGVLQNVGAPDPLAKELYIPGVFVTARAGNRMAAAAAATVENVGRKREGGAGGGDKALTVRFDPDNGVGRAWAGLGATRWPEPEQLLEARVLTKQLQATHADSPCRLQWITDKAHHYAGPGGLFSAAVPPPAQEAKGELDRQKGAGLDGKYRGGGARAEAAGYREL